MIIIPMAGLSSRFFKAGYTKPKYMLEAQGSTLFEHSVNSFNAYFSDKVFLFIVKDLYDTPKFVEEKAKKMGIENFEIVVLTENTQGQAETVALGLNNFEAKGGLYNGPITIFNIDTFRPNFEFPEITKNSDGYLEVFEGTGDNWSFAKPKSDSTTEVSLTAEKNPISNLCSTGLYHFNDLNTYLYAYAEYLDKPESEWEQGELYIAPLYNLLISKGLDIHYHLIAEKDVIFCGTPDEYTSILNKGY
ncbi:capsular biosynthesis protein [Enterovibrio norvegicus]|uniref:dTDP-glucose pyrophosphorylase n=1 Tax=Enterovibrio norvegicus DSM 15893 TaxID=1121869 RepID=A0A1I5S7C1_9GAMM|nr:capsular biosynthesis protein [Enterovibrio norvegicus]SFP66594.1 hypothetical protein SAMN03084138_02807 [Enterovibrio norvegicus DSM 15893]